MLYYYTNVETMKHILQDANIFATNLIYMNDAEEYFNGLKELRDIINTKSKQELLNQERLEWKLNQEVTSYSISFSTAKDLLSQWSMYAGESGVSLAMEFSGKERYRGYSEDGKRERVSDLSILPRKVHYCTKTAMTSVDYKQVKGDIWKAIEENNKSVTLSDIKANAEYIWTEMTPYVKRYEFSAEEEYRLVFDWAQLRERLQIDYRNDANVLKPYLDIECEGGWPIQEITVGPGFNQDVVFNSILHFLNHSKIEVPELDEVEYIARCKKYFYNSKALLGKGKEVWKTMKCELRTKGVKGRYEAYQEIKRKITKALNEDGLDSYRLSNSELSKGGIILMKSGIPYIF
ncbi:MAG: hypothetical protein HDR07_10795 [Lachnospiraceae bacterium]|nr:hypothetical protein [Lachnospiraceae bacterium]